MINNRNLILFCSLFICIWFDGFFLWFKIFLPFAYYLSATIIAALIAVQIITKSKFTFASIILLLVFLNATYYISTNYQTIPFGDANYDYGVARTFLLNGRISSFQPTSFQSVSNMAYYSEWPVLHSFAVQLSLLSGVDIYYIAMLVPMLLSVASFIFVALIASRIRRLLNIDIRFEYFTLLIYACASETLDWQIQFVRQNIGLMLFFGIMALLLILATSKTLSRVNVILLTCFSLTLVLAHHYTSLMLVLFLFGFIFFQKVLKSKFYRTNKIFAINIFQIILVVSVSLLLWWDTFASLIWTYITAGIQQITALFTGGRSFQYLPVSAAFYPAALTPTWATDLLLLREVLIYSVAAFGFLILLLRRPKSNAEFFLILSVITFIALFAINDLLLRVEITRVLELAIPFTAILGGFFAAEVYKRTGGIWNKLVVFLLVFILIPAAFIGLWGNSYAPMQLYNPSISFNSVGERSPTVDRIADFIGTYVNFSYYRMIQTDDDAPLIRLLNPNDYSEIVRVDGATSDLFPSSVVFNQTVFLYPRGTIIVFEFGNMNLYYYYSRQYSPIPNPADGQQVSAQLNSYLANTSDRIYDDGQYQIWVQ